MAPRDPPTPADIEKLTKVHRTLLFQAARLYALGFLNECSSVLKATESISKHIDLITNDHAD